MSDDSYNNKYKKDNLYKLMLGEPNFYNFYGNKK